MCRPRSFWLRALPREGRALRLRSPRSVYMAPRVPGGAVGTDMVWCAGRRGQVGFRSLLSAPGKHRMRSSRSVTLSFQLVVLPRTTTRTPNVRRCQAEYRVLHNKLECRARKKILVPGQTKPELGCFGIPRQMVWQQPFVRPEAKCHISLAVTRARAQILTVVLR